MQILAGRILTALSPPAVTLLLRVPRKAEVGCDREVLPRTWSFDIMRSNLYVMIGTWDIKVDAVPSSLPVGTGFSSG